MNDLALEHVGTASLAEGVATPLGEARVGDRGVIVEIRAGGPAEDHGVEGGELLRRLLEFGFVEGARVEVLHEGAIRRDPIALRLDEMRVALRRRDAQDVMIVLDRQGA